MTIRGMNFSFQFVGLVLFLEGYPPFDSKLEGANKKIHLRLHKKFLKVWESVPNCQLLNPSKKSDKIQKDSSK